MPESTSTKHAALALGIAVLLTAICLTWWQPSVPLWWLLALLALSAWVYALLPMLDEALGAVVEWLSTAIHRVRDELAGWRLAAATWLDRWFWDRFRQPEKRRN
jgi:MFS superfamily sulfate permease-like transporter